LLTSDFHFELPPELIAQEPAAQREASRLLLLDRARSGLTHTTFSQITRQLRAGDLLVLNNSRVIPARLRGHKADTAGQIEVLLVEETQPNVWWVLLRPGKRVRPGTSIRFDAPDGTSSPLSAIVTDKNTEGHCLLHFHGARNVLEALETLGEIPLPPYIHRTTPAIGALDRNRYQTVYADPPGSVAAPTAGLHFTPSLLDQVRQLGVHVHFVTLHVGLGTFAPVKTNSLEEHTMHEERFEIPAETASAVNAAKREQRRVIAVGTTSLRTLEAAAGKGSCELQPTTGRTRIFIRPPHEFQVVDALITNFHLPESTLLMLVSAFAAPGSTQGRERILEAYAEAIRERYRFFSYGDAMMIQ
jgi:S-adenosylmethionine:tRNA ribosyltransferase-isomerase